MLIGFSVSNYKSYYETQSISFKASKIRRHRTHVSSIGNNKILKCGVLFGANASGKSNLIDAVNFSRSIIFNGLDRVNLVKKHFRIVKDAYYLPAVFEYRMIVDQIEYSYGLAISYSKCEILGEWLTKINENGDEIYLFNREVDKKGISYAASELEYLNKDEKMQMNFYLEGFGENISDAYRKKTMLNDIALRSNEKKGIFADIIGIFKWFDDIVIILPNTKYSGLNEVAADDKQRFFYEKLMSHFDTGIMSIEGHEEEMDFEKLIEDIDKNSAEEILLNIYRILDKDPTMLKIEGQYFRIRKDENGNIIYNRILLNHGNMDDLFEYKDESDGTKRLFDLVPLLSNKMKDSVIFIDEIDRSFHTNATRQFVELFCTLFPDNNKQIFFTSHDTNLLDLDFFRQDEIWFVERQADHSSNIYSLNKYKERFDKRIDKDYIIGRYGAVPAFDFGKLEMEEQYDEFI